MTKRGLVLILAVVVCLGAKSLSAQSVGSKGDPAAGATKATACAGCHGASGVSTSEAYPNLAAQQYAYLVKQLEAFHDGTRKDPLMQPMAQSLSAQDMKDLAAFYSSLQAPSGGADKAATLSAAQAKSVAHHAPIYTSPAFVTPRMHPTRQYWIDKLPVGPGREVLVERCNACHDLQRTIAFVRPRAEWQNIVAAMSRRGSAITAQEEPVAVDYLTKYFGPDSPPIEGRKEVGMRVCAPNQWPKGLAQFRKDWVSPYNIWVSNQVGGSVDVVDPSTKKIVSRINCLSAPDRVEFSRDGNTAYVPDRVEHNVTVIDTRTGAIKAKVPLIDRPNVSVLTRDYKKLYVGIWPVKPNENRLGYIQVMDTATLKIIKTIEVKGGIHDLWMSADGKDLLAMSPEGRFMDLFDTRNDHKIWTCCQGPEIGTMNMEAAPDGPTSRIFFSYGGYSGIIVIDAKTGKELERVPHPVDRSGPYKGIPHSSGNGKAFGFHGGEISPDRNYYWLMQASFIYRYALPRLKPVGDVHLALIDQVGKAFTPPIEGSWLTLSPDGSKVFASRPGRNLLSIVDAATRKEEALIPTGEYPLHISVWPRGTP
jgi:YVTN family beta-propeller protein